MKHKKLIITTLVLLMVLLVGCQDKKPLYEMTISQNNPVWIDPGGEAKIYLRLKNNNDITLVSKVIMVGEKYCLGYESKEFRVRPSNEFNERYIHWMKIKVRNETECIGKERRVTLIWQDVNHYYRDDFFDTGELVVIIPEILQ